MTNKFDRDTYFRLLAAAEKAREYRENQIPEVPPVKWLTVKSILITAVIVAIALTILLGSILILPIVVVAIIGYLIFLTVNVSIK
jgi:hypothetical protein